MFFSGDSEEESCTRSKRDETPVLYPIDGAGVAEQGKGPIGWRLLVFFYYPYPRKPSDLEVSTISIGPIEVKDVDEE